MAIGIETPGQLSELFGILKKRRWQILLPVFFGVSVASAFAVFVPKKYEITTSVEIRERNVASEANSRSPKLPSTSREITNAENHIKHFGRIREVIEDEVWPEYELLSEIDKQEFIQKIKENLTVSVLAKRKDEGSTFMEISFLASDPERGRLFLNDLAKLWVDKVVDRERTAVREEAKGLAEQVLLADKAWREASLEAKQKAQEGGFSASELEAGGDNRLGVSPEASRLNTNIDQANSMRTDLAGFDAAISQIEAELLVTPEEIPVNSFAQGVDLSSEIVAAEVRIAEFRMQQGKVTPRNQTFRVLQDSIEELEEQIELLKSQQRSAEVVQDTQPNPARLEMQAQLESFRVERELLDGKTMAIDTLIQEGETAAVRRRELKEQFYVALQRRDHLWENRALLDTALQEKQIQSDALENAYGDPYEFVQKAFAPEKPSKPEPLLIITVGLFVGLMIGVGTSLAAEFSKDGYRTAADLARSMQLPVLGVIDRIATRREKSAAILRRFVVGGSSLVLLGAILGFTYVFSKRPELLPVEWLERLYELQSSLK